MNTSILTYIFESITIIILAATAFIGLKVYWFSKERIAPNVCIFLTISKDAKTDEDIRGFWNLTIKNFGLTTAYDIKIGIIPDIEFYCSPTGKIKLSDHSTIKSISSLVPSDERSFFIGSQFKGHTSYIPFDTQFEASISFKDKRKRKYTNEFTVDFNHLADISWNTMK